MLKRFLCLLISILLLSASVDAKPVPVENFDRTIKVICLGDSIVYGAGVENREFNNYPAQLQRMLGSKWEVENFGINSRIMQKQGDFPYWNEPSFQQAKNYLPDVVVISLGANDTKPQNWNRDRYQQDCLAMIREFQNLPSKPSVRLCYPCPAYKLQWGINDEIIRNQVIPAMDQVARQTGIELIDNYNAMSNKEALFFDKIHPNAQGDTYLAQSIYRSLTGKPYTTPPLPGKVSDYFGYQKYDFQFDGRACAVVAPKVEAPGRPWIWRARFFGHEPQTERWLLACGFHVAYIDVADMFGGPRAVGHWNAFYKYLIEQFGFSTKPALEGMSRGGLIVMNWAKKNPNSVSCIYIDAPVCDIRSWPGCKGKTSATASDLWQICLREYNLTDQQSETFADNPIDNLEQLAKADVPILSVCGDADTAAIMAENILVLKKRYKQLGGRIEIITKPGVGHHPHSLNPPTPIVNFIIANTIGLDNSFTIRDESLKNSKIRFERDKTGRVVFLGGSITHNPGWRDHVCEYLQKRFPETQFDFINAGIPSTGSTPGSFRLIRDVFSSGPVDLLFEEAAANDLVNGRTTTEQLRGIEGIIRHARLINPDLDIVNMYFVDTDKIARYNEGKTPDVIVQHDLVSSYYQVSSINLAREVTDRINAGQFTWKDDFKDVHPSPFGQKLYSDTIIRFLDTAWSAPLLESDHVKPHWIPETPLDQFSYYNGKLVSVDTARLYNGWSYNPSWHPADNTPVRPGFVDVPIVTAESKDALLELNFSGTAIGLFIVAGPDCGIIEYSVDGKPFKKLDQFTPWSTGLYIPWALMLETELAPGTHKLSLKPTGDKNANSKGSSCRIAHFLVN